MRCNPPISDWRDRRVWLIGASSGIGRAVAAQLHARGAQVIVSARQQDALDEFVSTHAGSEALAVDVTDAVAVAKAAQRLQRIAALDLVCYCAGHYRAQTAVDMDLNELMRHQQVNVTGALSVLAAVVPDSLKAARGGRAPHLSLMASVAGWRGLPMSLAYGPTKAALINLAECLYLDLSPHGVGVSVINPGFVDTPLTAQNRFTMPALISPQQAAAAIVRGWERGSFEIHFPKRFTWTLKLMRLLPDRWYFGVVRRVTGR